MNIIHITAPHGFWSNLLAILYHITMSIEKNQEYYVLWENRLYQNNNENLFDHFFVQKHSKPEDLSKHNIITDHAFKFQSHKGNQAGILIDLAKSKNMNFRQLMSKTFHSLTLQEHFKKRIDEFVFPQNIIGVHLRGQCKKYIKKEHRNSTVDAEVFCKHLKDFKNIFLASDSNESVKRFENCLNNSYNIIKYDSQRTNNTKEQIHLINSGDKLKKAEDVFMDTMLLSKCDYILRGTSNVTVGVLIVNDKVDFLDLSVHYKKYLKKL